MYSEWEINNHANTARNMMRAAVEVISNALNFGMSCPEIHDKYGVGQQDGTGVRRYGKGFMTLSAAYQILLAVARETPEFAGRPETHAPDEPPAH